MRDNVAAQAGFAWTTPLVCQAPDQQAPEPESQHQAGPGQSRRCPWCQVTIMFTLPVRQRRDQPSGPSMTCLEANSSVEVLLHSTPYSCSVRACSQMEIRRRRGLVFRGNVVAPDVT